MRVNLAWWRNPILCSLLALVLPAAAGASEEAAAPPAELRPIPARFSTEIFPEEARIRVRAEMQIDRSFVADGRLNFGLSPLLGVRKVLDSQGRSLPFSRDGIEVGVEIGSGRSTTEPLVVVLEYDGNPSSESQAYVGKELCFASWLSGWYPYLDGMSGFVGDNTFIVPEGLVVAYQGGLVSQTEIDGRREYHYRVTRPSYYSFAAAPFDFRARTIEGVEFRTYFLSGGLKKSDDYIERAAPIVACLARRFGGYPYDGLSLVELPVIDSLRIAGASEQGMVVFSSPTVRDDDFNFPVIAHEIGHMWWGNWVIGDTPVMSEGLAQLSNWLSTEAVYGEEIMRKYALNGSFDHFSSLILYLTRFAGSPAEEPGMDTRNFEYEDYVVLQGKGPQVFLMLRDTIGEQAFDRGLAAAVAKYAHSRMTMKQLQVEFEKSSSRDLDWFFDQWVSRPGAPLLQAAWSSRPEGGRFVVTGVVSQLRKPYYTLPIKVVVTTERGREAHVVQVDGERSAFSFTADRQPAGLELDPQRKSLWFSERDGARREFADAMSFTKSREQSIQILRQVVAKNPDDLLARAWLAKFGSRLHPGSEALVENLTYILNHADPHGEYEIYFTDACFDLAGIHDTKGERSKAVELYRRVIETDRTGRFVNLARAALAAPLARHDPR